MVNIIKEKKWYESKTLWINFFTATAAILTGVAEILTAGEAVTIMAILNILLRFVTTTKLN
jgi:hypothetical protein